MEEVWFAIDKDADGYPATRDWEGLRALRRGRHYEIRSVPFYAKGIAYGDIVRVDNSSEGFLKFQEVIRRGGYSVFRLHLHSDDEKAVTIESLLKERLLVEHDGKLIAIAVPPSVDLEKIVSLLLAGVGSGKWGAQDGYVHPEDDQLLASRKRT